MKTAMRTLCPAPFLALVALALVTLESGCPISLAPDGGTPPSGACANKKLDQDESDVDCGGVCGATCDPGQMCRTSGDCHNAMCLVGICMPAGNTCFDHGKDGDETDVDCGGSCPRCIDGKHCRIGTECVSGLCQMGVCAVGKPVFDFATARFFGVGRNPSALVVGDWNGDGKLDAATGDHTTPGKPKEVSVVLGNGDGTFADFTTQPIGGDPAALFAADLDGDGKLDLVTGNADTSTLTVLLNTGGGTFRALADVPSTRSPGSLGVGDFDRDGTLDLVVGGQGIGEVVIQRGLGGGRFGAPVATKLGSGAGSLAVGDWNSDGQLDVAVVSDRLLVLANMGGMLAMPTPIDAAQPPWFVRATDVNADGHPDLITSSYLGYLGVLVGHGDGTFAAPLVTNVGAEPWTIVSADFDSDGHVDLATGNVGSDTIQVLRGKGDGSFESAVNFFVGGSVQWIAVGDFNGDQKPDIALSDFRTHDVGVLLNRSGQ